MKNAEIGIACLKTIGVQCWEILAIRRLRGRTPIRMKNAAAFASGSCSGSLSEVWNEWWSHWYDVGVNVYSILSR